MRVLVNGLSIGSLSGQHVVFGFLSKLMQWTRTEHEFVIMHDERLTLPSRVLGDNVEGLPMSPRLRHWFRRTVWETTRLRRLIRRLGVDVVFNPSGAKTPNCPVPQVVLAQNPWCFVRNIHSNRSQRLRATLQRRGYRSALRTAARMFFISSHLRDLYRTDNNRDEETPSDITYVALNDETHAEAQRLRQSVERKQYLIVSVSAMAAWKGAETLVAAVSALRARGVPARLRLVGPWPDSDYESRIRQLIREFDLENFIEITGEVTRDELHRHYAEAQVFSLMSRCESFGIPAAEAQAFGTPVVASRGCAMPEICADGGKFGNPDDVEWTTETLAEVLTCERRWQTLSDSAVSNSQRFRWDRTAKPMMSMFSVC